MGFSDNPNGSDFTIVTDVLLYSVFATQATGISLENIQRITLLLQKKDIRTVNREFVSRKIAFLIVILMVSLSGIKKY